MTAEVNKKNSLKPRDWHMPYTDEGFIKIFAPFRIIQKLFGSCRVDITDGQVTAPTVFQKCYTIICLVVSAYLGRSMLMTFEQILSGQGRLTRIFLIGLYILHFMCALSNLHCRFINRGNVELLEKMQSVDRVMKLKCPDINKLQIKHYNYNRAAVLWMVGLIIAMGIVTGYLYGEPIEVLYVLGYFWGLDAFVLEMVCCVSHIKFFTMRVNLINSMIVKHLKKERFDGGSELKSHVHSIYIPNRQRQTFDTSDTDVYLNDIFNAFACFQDQYRFQVFTFCTVYVTWSLVSFQFMIIEIKTSIPLNQFLLSSLYMATSTTFEICMLLLLSLYSEELIRCVKKTKKLSNSIISRHVDGPLREKAKRMLKLIEHEPPRFSVYGMWYVDARLFLNMFSILTSYFVIILQFEL